MSKSKDEIIFTDLDLDGCCSYLAYCWLTQTKPKAVTIKVSSLRENFLGWLKRNKISDYKTVYFFDLDTTEIKDLIDNLKRINFLRNEIDLDRVDLSKFGAFEDNLDINKASDGRLNFDAVRTEVPDDPAAEAARAFRNSREGS